MNLALKANPLLEAFSFGKLLGVQATGAIQFALEQNTQLTLISLTITLVLEFALIEQIIDNIS
jgi:hypothetical protein